MGITDELREYATDAFYVGDPEHINLCIIANNIEAELAERYIELPKDAYGEYIHVGDVMEDADGEVFTVSSIDYGFHLPNRESAAWMLWSIDAEFNEPADQCRHHHEPTVEDVLRDMHAKLDEVTALYVGEAIDSDERDSDEARIFAEYAAKLRLVGDE